MGKSSKDKRDFYYRLAKEQGWRARSAFKLLQLHEQFGFLDGVKRVVDLCAAPGSWSQVLSRTLFPEGSKNSRNANTIGEGSCLREDCDGDIKIIALDLQPMTPLPHVTTLQADITHPATLPLLLSHLAPHDNADLVLSDGAPDVTGLHDLDSYIQGQLLLAALNLATCVLRQGGCFVAKIFRGPDCEVLFGQLATLFDKVSCAKPRSSRGSSIEAFVVCEGYRPPKGFKPSLESPLGWGLEVEGEEEEACYIAPFVACGDLSAWDSDATYQLPEVRDEQGNLVKWVSLDPVQPPTAPPYKTALEMRRRAGNAGKD